MANIAAINTKQKEVQTMTNSN